MDRKITRKSLFSFLLGLIKSDPLALLVIFALSLIAAISQTGIFLVVYKIFQADIESLSLFGYAISEKTLWGVIISLAIGAAFAPYLADRYIIRKTIGLFKSSLGQFGNYFTKSEYRNHLLISGLSVGELTRLMSSETRYASLAYASVLRSAFPIASILTFTTMMFWLNAKWTILILLAFFPFIIWQVIVLRSGMQLNRTLRDSASAHSRYVGQFIASLSSHFTSNRWGNSLTHDFDNFVTGKYPDAYKERLKLGISLRVIGDLAIVAVILFVSYLTFTKKISLEDISYVLIFAVLVRFLHSNIDRMITNLISIISQLPYYSLYISTLSMLSSYEPEKQDKTKIYLAPGINVVYTGEQINWAVAGQYTASHFERAKQESVIKQSVLLTSRYGMIKSDFISTFQLSPELKKGNFDVIFPNSQARWPLFEKMLNNMKGGLTEEKWRKVPAIIKFMCSISYSLKKDLNGMAVFVNGLDLNALTTAEVNWLFDRLSHSMVVIFYSNASLYRTTPKDTPFFYMNKNGKLTKLPVDAKTKQPHEADIKNAFDLDKSVRVVEINEEVF